MTRTRTKSKGCPGATYRRCIAAEQFIVQTDDGLDRTGIALTRRTAEQLPINARTLVKLGEDAVGASFTAAIFSVTVATPESATPSFTLKLKPSAPL